MQLNQFSLLFMLLFLAGNLCGQKFELAGISYGNFEKTEIKNSPTQQQIGFQEVSFFAKLPVLFKNKKTILLNNLRYGFVQANVLHSPLFLEASKRKNLHSISFSPVLVQNIGKKWKIIGTVTPTLASDFEEKLSSDDLLMQGLLLASVGLNEKWTLGGGLIYTAQLGDPRFLPAIQVRYRQNRHSVNMLLPSFAHYMYRFGRQEKFSMGIRVATNGGNFNVANRDFSSVIPNSINKIIQSRVNSGVVLHFQVTKSILLEASGGISTRRKFTLEGASNTRYNYDSSNSRFFNVGIMFTPVLKESKSENDNF